MPDMNESMSASRMPSCRIELRIAYTSLLATPLLTRTCIQSQNVPIAGPTVPRRSGANSNESGLKLSPKACCRIL
eukprot:9919649-Alexandrium_andersonii.AAC.1